jgi:endonuclease-3
MNVAFEEPTIAVDTHIFRVGNRTGIAPGNTPHAVELQLDRVTPPRYKLHAHHWLILHGRHVCKARKPDCPSCVVSSLCRYKAKTVPDELVAAKAAATTTAKTKTTPAKAGADLSAVRAAEK